MQIQYFQLQISQLPNNQKIIMPINGSIYNSGETSA